MNADEQLVDELREALAPELHLLDRLGSGGMGDVFLARDPLLKRNVAVKVLGAQYGMSPEARRRFAREAEAAAAVAHPNVVPIYRVGTLPRSELGYIIMAHVDGPSLQASYPSGTVASESEVRRIVAEVAAALAAAHARGVIHRDIKPANIIYDQLSGRFIVVDFGIASVRDRTAAAQTSHPTLEGLAIGTPEYMSPEQAAGDAVTDRSDIYSLGVLAYGLLAGRPPITGPTPAAVFFGHLSQTPPPLTTLRSDLSPEFAALITRCLAKEPDQRPDAEELTRALGFVRREAIEWPPPGLESLHRQGVRWVRSMGRFAAALLLFVLVTGIHPAAARPCCADLPDRSPGWLLLKRLSMVTPIRFDDPDALAIWYFLLDAVFFVLLAALIPFLVRTVALARGFVAGSRNGYPIAVLGRVAWDRHSDTVDLLNLMGRYAMVAPERQARYLRRRERAATFLGLAALLPIVTCLAWLGGVLDFATLPTTGLLPLVELLIVVVPGMAALAGFLTLEALDPSHRFGRRTTAISKPLRPDVLNAWIAVAGARRTRGRWNVTVVRATAWLVGLVGVVTLVAAAYGLIGVFGASARFAVDRAGIPTWLADRRGGTPSPFDQRMALAVAASVPIDERIVELLTADERALLATSVGPAFCLNPREVLFGIAAARLEERDRLLRRDAPLAADSVARGEGFETERLIGGGLLGLRRRTRFCEQRLGEEASISPRPKAAR